MSLIRKHVAVLQAWACLDLVGLSRYLDRTFAQRKSSQKVKSPVEQCRSVFRKVII